MMNAPVLRLSPSYALPRPDRLRRGPAGASAEERQILDQILPTYGLRATGRAAALGSGGRSDVLIVDTAAGQKMLKRYKANVEMVAVEHEHAILRFLAGVDFPAPRLSATAAGDTALRHDGRIYALFDYLNGYFQYSNYFFLPSQTRHFIASAGQALGALHDVSRAFYPPGHNPNGFLSRDGLRARELSWFTDKLTWSRQQAPFLNQAGAREGAAHIAANGAEVDEWLRSLDQRLATAGLTRTIIHGDYGPYNLLYKRDQAVVIIDFELARLDWPLVDLAKSMTTFASSRFGFSRRKAAAFLDAYRGGFDMDDDELRYLPDVWTFLTLRRVIVCWFRFCQDGETRWAKEATEKLNLARRIAGETANLSLTGK